MRPRCARGTPRHMEAATTSHHASATGKRPASLIHPVRQTSVIRRIPAMSPWTEPRSRRTRIACGGRRAINDRCRFHDHGRGVTALAPHVTPSAGTTTLCGFCGACRKRHRGGGDYNGCNLSAVHDRLLSVSVRVVLTDGSHCARRQLAENEGTRRSSAARFSHAVAAIGAATQRIQKTSAASRIYTNMREFAAGT